MKTTITLILSAILFMVAVLLTGSSSVNVEPTPTTPTNTHSDQPIKADKAAVGYDKVAVSTEKSKVPPVTTPEQWVEDVMREHGVTAPVPVRVAEGCDGPYVLGCTEAMVSTTTGRILSVTDIRVYPKVIGTDLGVFVVLHEVGHANGIVSECGADAFAHAHGADLSFHDIYC